MTNFVVTVRYGLMATAEKFASESDVCRPDDEVIVRTARGIDVGVAMGRPRPLEEGEETRGELLRLANEADQKILGHIRDSKEPEEFATCQACIRDGQLPMRLVGVEHLFSGDKIIFYFLAENRVDFRELVKELARRYRTRIEMRQIGVRDEARLLADYEHCGRELCCRTFIRNLEPVTMRMAKMQKTTLDPSKISGHCGRLMCCLRFEDEVYSSLQAEMPPKGSICVCQDFTGEVVAFDMFRQDVTLALPDGSQEVVHISGIKEFQPRRKTGDTRSSGAFSAPGPGGQERSGGRGRPGDSGRHGGKAEGRSPSRREGAPEKPGAPEKTDAPEKPGASKKTGAPEKPDAPRASDPAPSPGADAPEAAKGAPGERPAAARPEADKD